jgi:hypothetical protein
MNVAIWPTVAVAFCGCVVIVGPTGAEFTVSVAAELVAFGEIPLLTTTSKLAPLSPDVVAGVA